VSGEVVFVGHGLVAADPGYDDYAGVDVRGKIALALDGAPPISSTSARHGSTSSSPRAGVARARS